MYFIYLKEFLFMAKCRVLPVLLLAVQEIIQQMPLLYKEIQYQPIGMHLPCAMFSRNCMGRGRAKQVSTTP